MPVPIKSVITMLKFLTTYGILILFAIMGIATFIAYGVDKRAAKQHKWRIPEKTLLLMNIFGGFVGGWTGMFVFRHKTKHFSFVLVQTLSLILWAVAWSILWIKNL